MKLAGLAIAAFLIVIAAPAPGQVSQSSRQGWRLTPNGIGPVRIGMTRAQVESILGEPVTGDELTEGCLETVAEGLNGIGFMFEEDRLTRVSLGSPSRLTTPRGIGVGATEAQVRQAYGSGLDSEPHHYVGLPAKYLTFWLSRGRSGVRFETDSAGRVETIHAGTDSIEYVEGCL